jgi:hypothetical protein
VYVLNAQRITLWAAVALLLVIGAAPFLAMLTASVTIDGTLSLMYYHALVSSRRAWEGKSYWFLGVALERRLNERLKLGAELFGTTPQSAEDKFNLGFNFGGRYRWDPGRELIASIGRSLFDEPDLDLTYRRQDFHIAMKRRRG